MATDRRVLLGGAGVALAAGAAVAAALLLAPHPAAGPPPASQGGLQVEAGPAQGGRLEARKPLRCFVGGRFVGDLLLADCARRNGVATGALDVGLDVNGALSAGAGGSDAITPLPPGAEAAGAAAAPPAAGSAPLGPTPRETIASCWRYESGEWTILPYEMTLNACVRALYEGHCVSPGGAEYGRWSERTLRLLTGGEIQVSADNRAFHTLASQSASCPGRVQ